MSYDHDYILDIYYGFHNFFVNAMILIFFKTCHLDDLCYISIYLIINNSRRLINVMARGSTVFSHCPLNHLCLNFSFDVSIVNWTCCLDNQYLLSLKNEQSIILEGSCLQSSVHTQSTNQTTLPLGSKSLSVPLSLCRILQKCSYSWRNSRPEACASYMRFLTSGLCRVD